MNLEELLKERLARAEDPQREELQRLRSLSGRELRSTVESQWKENQGHKKNLQEVTAMLEQVRANLESICAPEHYPVVITRVTENSSLRVETAAPGGFRVQVAVHPDIDPTQLAVGRRGFLSRERNCLLHLEGFETDWPDVGLFEDYIDGGRRILLRHQDELVAVSQTSQLADTGLKKGDHIGFDLAVRLAYVRLSPPARESLFADDLPEDEFSQLGGLEQPIAQIQRALDFTIRFPEVAARYGVRDKRGILLCGPPGNGKTRLGRCTATYVSRLVSGVPCRFLSLVGASDVYSMWLGESERKLCEIFEAAEAAAAEGPVVLFFDEIDALGRSRGSDCGSSAPDRILSTFLGLLDGVKRLSGVIVMAATNRADTLDPALLRAGRFDLKIHIPRPNRSAARAVLQAYLKDLPLAASCGEREQIVEGFLSRIYSPNGEYSAVLTVKLNDGRNLPVSIKELVSGAMLENVVRMAAEEAAFRETRTGDPDGITEEDLVAALQQEICGIAGLITPANAKAYLGMIPQDAHPVAVSSVFQSNATRYIR